MSSRIHRLRAAKAVELALHGHDAHTGIDHGLRDEYPPGAAVHIPREAGLLDNGYTELPVTSQHAVGVDGLPDIHRDPFDRLLLAQALSEGITLVTSDDCSVVEVVPNPSL